MFQVMADPAGGVSTMLEHSFMQVVGQNMPGKAA
jgi:hypothetical protein